MAYNETYANFDLTTGLNDGTSEVNAWQTVADMVGGYVLGDRVNVKKTASRYSYTPVTHITFDINASASQRCWIRGYGTTIGDGVKFEIDIVNNTRYIQINGDQFKLSCWDVTGSHFDALLEMTAGADGAILEDCKIVNSNTGTEQSNAVECLEGHVIRCHLESNGTGVGSAALFLRRAACLFSFVKSTRIGVYAKTDSAWAKIESCVIVGKGGSATHGINFNGAGMNVSSTSKGNSFYNFTYGVYITNMVSVTSYILFYIVNNIFYDLTYGVYNADAVTSVWNAYLSNNGFGAITSANYTGLTDNESTDDYNISSDPFTDSANDDLSLVDGSDPIGAGVDAGGVG